MNKLLMLGGSNSQVPAIKKAKELGFYVITCDYLPDNPGHQYSDEYINISTTDKENVLKAAQDKKIDGIIAYASDPSAETAAFVVSYMGLHGADLRSTQILAEKDLFRNFQKEHGFKCPDFVVVSTKDNFHEKAGLIPLPCMVKPVDSSGSKGITKVTDQKHLYQAYQHAVKFSRKKKVIFEGYIETSYCQLHGDGFVFDNRLVFLELGDQRFYNCVPIGSSCPSVVGQRIKDLAWMEVSRLIEKVGFESGGINVEIRVGKADEIYIVEIGPRTGGNYVPQLMEHATGFEEMTAALEAAMGIYSPSRYKRWKTQYCFQYIIGAREEGIFQKLWVSPEIKNSIKELYLHKKQGDKVFEYENSSGVVGVAILVFDTQRQMEHVIHNIVDYIRVVVKKEE